MNKLRWDVIGLSEIRREGEDTKTLQSGHLFYYREGEQKSQGGVGFIVHKSLINNIVAIESVSSRVVYLVLKISKRYSLKIVQVYAPSTSHPDDEVEATYEDISRAIRNSQSHFTVVMGDFNAKLGRRGDDELKAWNRGVVILFFKKGDKTLLKNYRPIALLSHVYKLFSRVITKRLERRFDDFQPTEQAGFRKGYSTIDHIHTLRQIVQKTEEYNRPLCLAFVDYEKAFHSVETWAVLRSLQRCRIDHRPQLLRSQV
ncbi:uncharacterized protein LOC114247123 [Bombyx mandarina]|uniref:Uncharacterized protein LOC114247123 n=1 Tax=Bombyx mandarina TaxID=7092 RepID=A0A6J2K0P0_BOMMA|nr:uncharacterized protein LOC114247123 [Bombyx mandarina]